jgi:hypothetical protein
MTNPSNLYAEKVYKHQPLSLWTLDDKIDYLSYITEVDRNFSLWTPSVFGTTCLLQDPDNVPRSMILDTSKYLVTVPNGNSSVTLTSNSTFTTANDNFTIGLYVYATGIDSITGIRVGYKVGSSATVFLDSETISVGKWGFVSQTFQNSSVITAKIVIEISYAESLASGDSVAFYLNGLSVGRLSEEFNKVSVGVHGFGYDLSEISVIADDAIIAGSYGKAYSIDSGLYLIKNKKILAKNSTIPMVFGASNSTVIIPNTNNQPSIILPAKGFMNERSRSSTMTLEAWLRVNSKVSPNEYRKIVGPLNSTNGIYVNGPNLVVRYGDVILSHNVVQWFKPMLVHLAISDSEIKLFVDGEYAAGSSINRSSPLFVESQQQDENFKSQDFLGFYAYPDLPTLEVDAVAIYPMMLTQDLANIHFLYGQALKQQENVNVAYDGKSFFVDYGNAEYARNFLYPDNGKWEQGISDNLSVENNRLVSTQHRLPTYISSTDSTIQQVVDDSYDENAETQFICLRPKDYWEGVNSYILFESFNNVSPRNDMIFGVFEGGSGIEEEQILFKIENKSNEYIKASITSSIVSIVFKQNGEDEISLMSEFDITDEEYSDKFVVGINANTLASLSSQYARFFGNPDSLKIFLGGDYSGTDLLGSNTYTGKIYAFSFATQKHSAKYSAYELEGIVSGNSEAFDSLVSDASSYTLFHNRILDVSLLDIKTYSYWEDYMSLAYLSSKKYIYGENRNIIDSIQINFNYPQSKIFSGDHLDTSKENVRAYVSFQKMNQGLHLDTSDFTRTPVPKNGAIFVGDNWETTLYEIVDGSVISMPILSSGVASDTLAISLIFEIRCDSLLKQVKIRDLQYASRSLDDNSTSIRNPINGIGSRFGEYAYPYVKYGNVVSYKDYNPVRIYKGSTPYLYLTSDSGISMVSGYEPEIEKGILIPINKSSDIYYNISSLQFSILWNIDLFPAAGSPEKMFEIVSESSQILFYVESVNSERTRAKIFAKRLVVEPDGSTSESDYSALGYFLNGNTVKYPVITIDEWATLGLIFYPFLDFSGATGSFRVRNQFFLNNLSYYQLSEISQTQQLVKRKWNDIWQGSVTYDWNRYYTELGYSWKDLLYFKSDVVPPIDPSEIYKIYIGTNKIIADSNENSNKIKFQDYEYVAYLGTEWDRITTEPR